MEITVKKQGLVEFLLLLMLCICMGGCADKGDDTVTANTSVTDDTEYSIKLNSDNQVKICGEVLPTYIIDDGSELYFIDKDIEQFAFGLKPLQDGMTYQLIETSDNHNRHNDSNKDPGEKGYNQGYKSYSSDIAELKASGRITVTDKNNRDFKGYTLIKPGEDKDGLKKDSGYKLISLKVLNAFGLTAEVGSDVNQITGYHLGESPVKEADNTASDTKTAEQKSAPARVEVNESKQSDSSGAKGRTVINAQGSAGSSSAASGGGNPVIVLDPGHGKSTGAMSSEELTKAGFTQYGGSWGEWRHFKNGTWGEECQGGGCAQDYSCFYYASNGDRVTEPEINLNNANAAKKYLEQMGYTVRMTRTTNNEHPSFNVRASYAFADHDKAMKGDPGTQPDAACIVCIHSNAGGGSGSCYISPDGGNYKQKYLPDNFISKSNTLGEKINKRIVNETSLGSVGNGKLGGMNYLILFHKAPVPVAYMEIGFFDNSSDLAILNSEYDKIGKAIAEGVDEWYKQNH